MDLYDFRRADSTVFQVFLDLLETTFPELSGYSFGLLFSGKMKKKSGNLVLAQICLPSKLLRHFALNDRGNPYDFIILVDEMAWACAREADRIRLMRHELRHVFIDDKGNCRLVGHDYEDFQAEVELNHDQADWGLRLAQTVMAGYSAAKDGNDPRDDRRDADDIAPVEKDPQRQTHLPLETKSKANKTSPPGDKSKMEKDPEGDSSAQAAADAADALSEKHGLRPKTVKGSGDAPVGLMAANNPAANRAALFA